uniref:hypothetical protein n=1 Tax=Prevotella sp. TaxID=59823 RepID=UPI003FF14205
MKKLTEPPHKEIVRPSEIVIATAEEHQQDAQDRANNGYSDRNEYHQYDDIQEGNRETSPYLMISTIYSKESLPNRA